MNKNAVHQEHDGFNKYFMADMLITANFKNNIESAIRNEK